MDRDLEGRVALVAGATRGAGRGIAAALGERGAIVWCTGRSSQTGLSPMNRPETIEESAGRVTAAGGVGIAARVDHSVPGEVEALAERIRREHGGLDLVVDDIWGGERFIEFGVPVWEMDLDKARRMIDGALLTHLVNVRYLSSLLRGRRRPLWVEVTDGDHFGYRGTLVYDLVKMTIIRLAFGLAQELRPEGITALAITPGFLRSEEMLDHLGVTEESWREGAQKDPNFAASETPLFVGRAVAALAADPDIARHSGRVLSSWDIAREHGLTDIDGRKPHWAEHFAAAYGRPYRRADDDAYTSWEKDSMIAIMQAASRER